VKYDARGLFLKMWSQRQQSLYNIFKVAIRLLPTPPLRRFDADAVDAVKGVGRRIADDESDGRVNSVP
jgi:hypothetical protein